LQPEETLFTLPPSMQNSTPQCIGLHDTQVQGPHSDVVKAARASRRGFPGAAQVYNVSSLQLTEQVDPHTLQVNNELSRDQQLDATEQRVIELGHSAQSIKEYVGAIRDRVVLRRIKDQERNLAFRKVVLDTSSTTTAKLICEAEDFVIVVGTVKKGYCDYWLVKQDPKLMLREEVDILARLTKGHPVDRGKFQAQIHVAQQTMEAIRDLACCYLA